MVATSGALHLGGTITATFTWQAYGYGYGYGTAEDPPKAVVIKETCNADWYGASDTAAVPSGSSSNGLGFSYEQTGPYPYDPRRVYVEGRSVGTRYKIKQDPGASFSITCSPDVQFSGTGSLGPPPAEGRGGGEIRYQADAQPLEVVLSGGIGGKDSKRYLIGQRVGATLSSGGLTATSYFWGVSDGEPFKSYSADKHKAFVTPLDFATSLGSSFGFHFKEPALLATVTCSAHLAVPTGALPAEGLDVSPFAECGVDEPSSAVGAGIGTVQSAPIPGAPGMALTGVHFIDVQNNDVTGGIVTWGVVTTPASFGPATGGWNFTQLVTPNRSVQIGATTHNHVHNSSIVLDTTFGYLPYWPTLWNADGQQCVADDEPREQWPDLRMVATRFYVGDAFGLYILYLPPGDGSALVPLKKFNWNWQGSSAPDSNGRWQLSSTNASCNSLENLPDHPEWGDPDDPTVSGNVADIPNGQWNPPIPPGY